MDFIPLSNSNPPPPPPPSPGGGPNQNNWRASGGGGRGRGRGGQQRQGRGRNHNRNHNHNRGRGGGGRGNNNNNNHWNNRNNNHRNNNNNNNRDNRNTTSVHVEPTPSTSQTTSSSPGRTLRIAVEGCCHGNLDLIYSTLLNEQQQQSNNNTPPIDLLLCCGDFQSLRNLTDFTSLACPDKYKELGTFHKYYSGQTIAPIPTVFIGGNHEASIALQELFYGGFVAPNIYYMGCAGVIRFGGIRIAGLSGIYKQFDYDMGHFEFPPYDRSSLRSVYHVRRSEVCKLSMLRHGSVDIMLSHDWPRGIERYGDTEGLLRKKKFFRKEVEANCLGSPAGEVLLHALKPKRWFAAHLHVKFEAVVRHGTNDAGNWYESGVATQQQEQGDGNGEEKGSTKFHGIESDSCNPMESLTEQMTKFLSLDKCLPKRQFLQIFTVPRPPKQDSSSSPSTTADHDNDNDDKDNDDKDDDEPPQFEYDLEWLAILRKTHNQLTINTRTRVPNISNQQPQIQVTQQDINEVQSLLQQKQQQQCPNHTTNPLQIPSNFVMTVPPHGHPQSSMPMNYGQMIGNPQTDSFLDLLGLDHVVTVPYIFANPNSTNGNGDDGDVVSSLDLQKQGDIGLDNHRNDNNVPQDPNHDDDNKDEMIIQDSDEIDLDDDDDDDSINNGDTNKNILDENNHDAPNKNVTSDSTTPTLSVTTIDTTNVNNNAEDDNEIDLDDEDEEEDDHNIAVTTSIEHEEDAMLSKKQRTGSVG